MIQDGPVKHTGRDGSWSTRSPYCHRSDYNTTANTVQMAATARAFLTQSAIEYNARQILVVGQQSKQNMKKPDDSDHLVLSDWMTPAEAAKLIGVTDDHIRHLARAGTLMGRRFGHAWMISCASVKSYAAKERRPGPKPRESSTPD